MSAQPHNAHEPIRPVVHLPRTIRAVRAALDEESRATFAAELDGGSMPEVFDKWWSVAVVASSTRTVAALAELDAGALRTVPAAEVFGDRWAA